MDGWPIRGGRVSNIPSSGSGHNTQHGRQQTSLHYHTSRTPVANQTAPVGKLLLLRPPSSYISSHQNTAVKSLFGTGRRRRHLMPPDDTTSNYNQHFPKNSYRATAKNGKHCLYYTTRARAQITSLLRTQSQSPLHAMPGGKVLRKNWLPQKNKTRLANVSRLFKTKRPHT